MMVTFEKEEIAKLAQDLADRVEGEFGKAFSGVGVGCDSEQLKAKAVVY